MSAEPDRRPTVLFVDDDESVCRSMARCLERNGFQVTVVGSGAEALERLAQRPFDAIVTDHQMPAMSGAELVERLVAQDASYATRIVLTSGDIQAERIDRLIKASQCRGLAKPYTPADLALAIKAAIGSPGRTLTAA